MRQEAVKVIHDSNQVQSIAQPIRMAALSALSEPNSAAGVARLIGKSRQQVNYHLKALAENGLIRTAGERRKGNFVEKLYQAVARRFVIAPKFATDPAAMAQTLRDQVALAQLRDLGEHLQRDATILLDSVQGQSEQIPSTTIEAEVSFADEEDRGAFLTEYVELLKPLLKKYGRRKGEPFRVAIAAYPKTEDS